MILLLLLKGCSTKHFCDYDLLANQWSPISTPPEVLRSEANEGSVWFTNSAGDYIACYKLKGKNVCSGIYEIH